jgi:sulfopyruvate decarboxylase TPP-binding subunit
VKGKIRIHATHYREYYNYRNTYNKNQSTMKLNKKYLGITALLSATAAVSVFAAGATGTTATVMNKAFGNRSHATETAEQKTERQSKMATSLASALGTTPEAIIAQLTAGKTPRDIISASGMDETTVKAQLEASREADMKARLQADVTSGKITQSEADTMLANKGDNHDRGGRGGDKERNSDGMLTNAATILGTTKEALQSQLTTSKTLQDIVTASGITEADFRTKMDALHQTEMKTKLQADVTSGKMTQSEADTKLTDMVNHKGGPRGAQGAAPVTQ